MISRIVLISLVSGLIFIPNPTYAVNFGEKCRKVGVTREINGQSLVCVKKGKKLSWRKNSQPERNAFMEPFPDNFTRKQMVQTILTNFNQYESTNSAPKKFKSAIDSRSETNLPEVQKFLEKIYAVLPFPKDYKETIIVISQDREFTEKEIVNFGLSRTDSNQAAGAPCLNCAGERWASSDNGLAAVTPHEIFHVWQKAAYNRKGNNNPDPKNPLNPPIWFDEGGADFFGYLLLHTRTKTYVDPGSFRPFKTLRDYRTRDLDPGLPYLFGRLASEYIVASVGFEKFLQIHWNVGDGMDFPSAFEKATGISIEVFYEKFDRNAKNFFER